MLAPATGLLTVFILVPMLLDDLAVVPGLVDADRLRHRRASSACRTSSTSSPASRSAATSRPRLSTPAIYTVLSVVIDPAAVGRPSGCSSTRTWRPAASCCAPSLFSTYMVPMIAVALVFSKLYSPTEGPINQILGWVGIARAALAVLAANGACLDRTSSMSGSRSAISPCSPSPDSRRFRIRSTRRPRSMAPIRCSASSSSRCRCWQHAAVFGRDRHHQLPCRCSNRLRSSPRAARSMPPTC